MAFGTFSKKFKKIIRNKKLKNNISKYRMQFGIKKFNLYIPEVQPCIVFFGFWTYSNDSKKIIKNLIKQKTNNHEDRISFLVLYQRLTEQGATNN